MAAGFVPQLSCPLCLRAHAVLDLVPVTLELTLEKQRKTIALCTDCIAEITECYETWKRFKLERREGELAAIAAPPSEIAPPEASAEAEAEAELATSPASEEAPSSAEAPLHSPPRARRRARR